MGKSWKWQQNRDPLYRGDSRDELAAPVPNADPSIVRHILYLGGHGRDTPYLSATESEQVARRFAGDEGAVWATSVPKAKGTGVRHLSRVELLGLLKGKGHGDAKSSKHGATSRNGWSTCSISAL